MKMKLCDVNKEISNEVLNFIKNVPDVGEESITDYLLWQWRKSDNRFNYLDVKKFTKSEENKTSGADFEVELWFLGRSFCIPMVVQAKKFLTNYGGYRRKLNYPDDTQEQLRTLLSYAKSKDYIPFYFIYTVPECGTTVLCCEDSLAINHDTGIYIASAYAIEGLANKLKGKRLSRDRILKESSPLHCLFCCPLEIRKVFTRLCSPEVINFYEEYATKFNGDNMPEYVRYLVSNQAAELEDRRLHRIIVESDLKKYRYVATFDMRDEEESLPDRSS
jgi:hypothetical protein